MNTSVKVALTLLCVSVLLVSTAGVLAAFGCVALGNIFGWTGVTIMGLEAVAFCIFMLFDIWND